MELTVDEKGKVTLPQGLLDHMGVGPGDRVELLLAPEGKIRITAYQPKRSQRQKRT